ncbi:hypothetical protein GCM10022255_065400 [Dactylosporangium darangshiense]|uniref:Uncharacterized protein n=1 Tax=Dactylosporangium darangshiense TaxID=579108 RepID=A0ABP8DGV4_9ACTN
MRYRRGEIGDEVRPVRAQRLQGLPDVGCIHPASLGGGRRHADDRRTPPFQSAPARARLRSRFRV